MNTQITTCARRTTRHLRLLKRIAPLNKPRSLTQKIVYVDFESQSHCNLDKAGSYRYVQDPTTHPLCLGFRYQGKERVLRLDPYHLKYALQGGYADELRTLALDPEVIFCCHNIAFDRTMYSRFMVELWGFPDVPIERWKDTMAKAYMHGLPPALNKCAHALGLPGKDADGHESMLFLCKPRGYKQEGELWTFREAERDFLKMYKYNRQDLRVTENIDNYLRNLSPLEQEIWCLDRRINERGLRMDIPLVEKILTFIEKQKEADVNRFKELTGLQKCTRDQCKKWLFSKGYDLPNMQGPTVDLFLLQDDLPALVREVVEVYASNAKTSLAKYAVMMRQKDDDDVIREIAQYNGAHTGRWAHRGVQFGNLPLPEVDIYTCVEDIMRYDFEFFSELYPNVTVALSSVIRGMVIAKKNKRVIFGDLRQMEARILCWLAGQRKKLQGYREGIDQYCLAASLIFGREITKADGKARQTGKISELSLGFGGGIHAYAKMSRQKRIDLKPVLTLLRNTFTENEIEDAETDYLLYVKRHKGTKKGVSNIVSPPIGALCSIIKQRWRAKNPEVVALWAEIEAAAIEAAKYGLEKGMCIPVKCANDRVTFFMHKQFLICRLPSGRDLYYPYPRLVYNKRGRARLEYRVEDPERGGWVYDSTYGGKLTENIVQAIQRDIQAYGMLRLDRAGYDVIMHVHDETGSEVGDNDESKTVAEFSAILSKDLKWTNGLPIDVEAWDGYRYNKAA